MTVIRERGMVLTRSTSSTSEDGWAWLPWLVNPHNYICYLFTIISIGNPQHCQGVQLGLVWIDRKHRCARVSIYSTTSQSVWQCPPCQLYHLQLVCPYPGTEMGTEVVGTSNLELTWINPDPGRYVECLRRHGPSHRVLDTILWNFHISAD